MPTSSLLRPTIHPGIPAADIKVVENDDRDHGDSPDLIERLIIAPGGGRFEPLVPPARMVVAGDVLGTVVTGGVTRVVTADVGGRFMGHLAEGGELVRDAQPIAWIRITG